MSESAEGKDDQNSEATKAQVLWSEYKYRHDLIWRVVFQITTAAVVLSVIPYVVDKSLVKALGNIILLAPGTALAFIVFGALLIINELYLLSPLRPLYREMQENLYNSYSSSNLLQERKNWSFKVSGIPVTPADIFAVIYLVALLAVGVVNFFVIRAV